MQTATIDRSKHWTVKDYLKLEEGLLAQLIDGHLIMSPAPSTDHQRILRNVYDEFKLLKLKGELFFAPIDLYMSGGNVLQPDLVFVSDQQKTIITKRGIEGVPDLIVEVLSPSNMFVDRNSKKRKYLEAGLKEYWIVDPAYKSLEIYVANTDEPDFYLTEGGKVSSKIVGNEAFDLKAVF